MFSLFYIVRKPQTSEQEVDQPQKDNWLDERSDSWTDDDIPVQVTMATVA